MRYLTASLLLLSACTSAESKQDTAANDSGAWWVQDTASDSETGETDEPDEDNEDNEDDEFEPGTSYYGVVDVETWSEGFFVHEFFDVSGNGCVIEGGMINISTPGTCSDCVIDMSATIVGLEVVEDLGGCQDSASVIQEFEGLEVAYGQGSETLFEEEGLTFYDLFKEEEDSWSTVSNGFSVTGVDEESGLNLWAFYLFTE